MAIVMEISMQMEVKDATSLWRAAAEQAVRDRICNDVESAKKMLLVNGEIQIAECIRMLVDLGSLPGCETLDSQCEFIQP